MNKKNLIKNFLDKKRKSIYKILSDHNTPIDAHMFVDSILVWNPKNRPTVDELLNHVLFSSLHSVKNELVSMNLEISSPKISSDDELTLNSIKNSMLDIAKTFKQ